MSIARLSVAACGAFAPCLAAWHEALRDSLAALSFSACAVAAGVGVCALPLAPRSADAPGGTGAFASALRSLAFLAPGVALTAALDLRAGCAPVSVACVVLAGLAALALLAAAGASAAARGSTALHLASVLGLVFAAPALEWTLELGGGAAAPAWLHSASALSPLGFAWRHAAPDVAASPAAAAASVAGALLVLASTRVGGAPAEAAR